MRKLLFHVVSSVVLVGLFILGLTVNAGAEPVKVKDFTARDIEGNKVSLSSYSDKVVVLDFWATWCPPCRKEIPHLIDIKKTFKNKKFEIISVALERGSDNAAVKFVKDKKMDWVHIIDKQKGQELAEAYNIKYIPTMFVIQNGEVVATGLRGDDLKNKLKELLGR